MVIKFDSEEAKDGVQFLTQFQQMTIYGADKTLKEKDFSYGFKVNFTIEATNP
ncbi:MAG: hypothetical protein ACI9QD_001139 [Thermoproteota archaeon]|jgi:hypothetical protein